MVWSHLAPSRHHSRICNWKFDKMNSSSFLTPMKTTITIQGTHCASCKALIEDVCKDIQGISSCTVHYETGETIIEHNENIDWELFKKEIESLGKYTVHMKNGVPKNAFSSSDGIMVVCIIGSILLFVAWVFWSGTSSSSRTNREVALTCTSDMATQFHIHPHLEIFINGNQQEVPANIGIQPGCMNSLHTHDASGTLHVESPEKRNFTLSDFFAVWRKTFTKDQIFDNKIDGRHIIRETINGKAVQDYENTVLQDKDQIIIYYEEKK